MKKFLSSLFVLIFLFALPQPAEALYRQVEGSNNFKDYWFAIYANNDESNPPEFVKNTGDIIVNVTAWQGGTQKSIFTVNDRFDIFFENKDTNYKCRRAIGYDTTDTIDRNPTADQLTFHISPKNIICDLTPGTYTVSAWSSRDDKPWFILNDFPINSPAGGSSAKLAHVNQAVACMNQVTEARIENAEVGKTFNVYWKGDLGQYAWQGPASVRYFPVSLKGPEGGMKAGSKLDLCLIEGPVNFVPAVQFFACSNSLTFDVKAADDPVCTASSTPSCSAEVKPMENGTAKKQIVITGSKFPASTQVRGDLLNRDTGVNEPTKNPIQVNENGTVTYSTGELAPGKYAFYFYPQDGDTLICPIDQIEEVTNKIETGNTADSIKFKPTTCTGPDDKNCARSAGEYCDEARTKLKTAIGCVPVDPGLFIAGGMRYITGFSGGVALLMMIFGAFQMMTSGGNPESLKKGREQFVSAIIGLLFVIFAVLLMQIIGVDLLGLPGFKK